MTLSAAEDKLKMRAALLESAQEFARAEEEVEPSYVSGAPDFDLARIEVDAARES